MTAPKKNHEGKPAYEIVFSTPIDEVAKAFTFGESKYPFVHGDYNWRAAISLPKNERRRYVEKLMAAAIRHISAEFDQHPSDAMASRDDESGLPHLAHACANLLMALDILD